MNSVERPAPACLRMGRTRATADWTAFAADFLPEALLYPSARLVTSQNVSAFLTRMKQLPLHTFHEDLLGAFVRVFGNVAIVMAACEITENSEKKSRGVEALLLIKDQGQWKIASQAWDIANDMTIPEDLLSAEAFISNKRPR